MQAPEEADPRDEILFRSMMPQGKPKIVINMAHQIGGR